MSEPQDIKCVLVKGFGNDTSADWYVLERAEHDGREWMEPHEAYGININMWCRSARLHKHACIEGTAAEWREIAWAIEHDESEWFKRCGVARSDNGYRFYSPRNTNEDDETLLTFDAAKAVAAEIRRVVGDAP